MEIAHSGQKQCCQSDPRQNFFSDLGRMAGVNEVIGVYLMAKKLNIPVCPHAGQSKQGCENFKHGVKNMQF